MGERKKDQAPKVFPPAILRHVEELTSEVSIPLLPSSLETPLKLIPWQEIWSTLKVARVRGNGEMIEVFYDTLFKEAVFDDHGAWALDLKGRR